MTTQLTRADRPAWPKRAVVTAGMPYGNKGLHFGHVGGVFVPADFYARFLRDRLGRENVIFVSGTDCYGSPIMEGFRKRQEADDYKKHISDYVRENHDSQEADLASFGVSCDLYAGSALEPAVHIHERVTSEIIRRLHEKGALEKRSTKQFYDRKAGQFLNGRQVLGRCPIQGCKSEKAYADECDLGHQFEPEELIAPKSALTGETPELVPVDNLYFDLPEHLEYLKTYTKQLEHDPTVRSVVSKTMEEWLNPAQLYIQNKFREAFDAIEGGCPPTPSSSPRATRAPSPSRFPAGASEMRPMRCSTPAACASAPARRSSPSASRETSSGACPSPTIAAAPTSPAGSGQRAYGRPSASPARCSRATPPNSRPRARTPPASPNAPSPMPSSLVMPPR